jgi:hypothetical protein
MGYARRKEWEARRVAVEIVKALAEAMDGGNTMPTGRAIGLAEFEHVTGSR